MIVSDSGGGAREPTPTGAIGAVCSNVYDLGMQPGFDPGTFAHKVVVMWELNETLKEGEFAGKRFTISQTFTASLNDKANLCKVLESWRGIPFTAQEKRGFDLDKIIGKPCMLNIVPKARANGEMGTAVAAVMPLPKGMEIMTPELPRSFVPKWVQKILAAPAEQKEPEFKDDLIPF